MVHKNILTTLKRKSGTNSLKNLTKSDVSKIKKFLLKVHSFNIIAIDGLWKKWTAQSFSAYQNYLRSTFSSCGKLVLGVETNGGPY